MINCGRQAGAGRGGAAGELTPCTTAATPACRPAPGGPVGRARQAPGGRKSVPGKDGDSLLAVKIWLPPRPPPVPLPGSPPHGASSGGSCAPRTGSASVLSGISLTGGFSPPASLERTPRWHRKRQELALGSPPSSESLLLCAMFPAEVLPDPPAPAPFPGSTPAAGVEVGAHVWMGQTRSRLAPVPLHLLLEWSPAALCPAQAPRPHRPASGSESGLCACEGPRGRERQCL